MLGAALGLKTKEELAKRLGVGRTTLYYVENDDSAPSDRFVQSLEQLEREAGLLDQSVRSKARLAKAGGAHSIPVVSWAHAGDAACYEELPKDWQDQVMTDCRDPRAFALRLQGDSMAKEYLEGDVLILQPSHEIYSGCLAVVKLANDGIIFRRIEKRPDRLILSPLNTQYRPEDLMLEHVVWAYPLYGMYRQVWK